MKRLKFLLAFIFILIGSLTVFAVTLEKSYKSATIQECMRYKGYQPASSAGILNPINWESSFGNPYSYCFNGDKICTICFDNFYTTPGQARQILYDYYLTHGYFPFHGQIISEFNGRTVQVFLKEIEE